MLLAAKAICPLDVAKIYPLLGVSRIIVTQNDFAVSMKNTLHRAP